MSNLQSQDYIRISATALTPPSVVLGFRPEETEIHLSAAEGAPPATVEAAHFQGDWVTYQLRLGAETIQVSGRALEGLTPSSAVWVTVAPTRLHIFDRESGARLRMSAVDATHSIARAG